MAVTHVQTKTLVGGSGTSGSVSISSTAGNTLVLSVAAYSTTNATFTVTGISDSHNTWTFSSATSNQNPPVGQSWDGAVQGFSLLGAVVNAAAVTTVTVNFSKSIDYIDLTVYEFSGVTAGSVISVAASSSTSTSGTSKATPSVTAPSGAEVAVSTATNDGSVITGVSSGWTLDGADASTAYQVSPSAGSLSATFSGTASQEWPSSAILVIAPASGNTSTAAVGFNPAISANVTVTNPSGITVVQSTQATASSGTTITGTFASNVTAGNCIIAAISTDVAVTVSSVKLGTSADNWASAVSESSALQLAAVWADPNSAGGSASVTVTFNTSLTNSAALYLYEVSGLAASSVTDLTSGSNGSTSSWTSGTTGTTTQANELWVGVIGGNGAGPGGTITGPSGWTNNSTYASGNAQMMAGYKVVSSTGTATYNGTSTGMTSYAAAVATFKSASTSFTSTVAVGFNPATSASVTVANPVTATAAVNFTPAVNVNALTEAPVTTTAAMGFNPAIAASVLVPYMATAGLAFTPNIAANVTVANPVTATASLSFNPAISGHGTTGVTTNAAMGFHPSIAASAFVTRDLMISLAPVAGTDVYGNSYPAGLFVNQGSIQGSTIEGSTFMGTNWLEDDNGMFLYSGTPTTGNLLLSVAPSAGTDAYGNSYQAGFTVFNGPSAYLLMHVNTAADAPSLEMSTGASFESDVASIHTFPAGSGSTEFLVTRIDGPGSSLDNEIAAIQLSSNYASSGGGTVQGQLIQGAVQASWDANGFHVYNNLGVTGNVSAANFSGSYRGGQTVSGWPIAAGANIGTVTGSNVFITTGFVNALNSMYNALVNAGLI